MVESGNEKTPLLSVAGFLEVFWLLVLALDVPATCLGQYQKGNNQYEYEHESLVTIGSRNHAFSTGMRAV